MKRIIKLTESDITRIVKRVIKEEKLSKQDILKKHVLKNGWREVANRIGGFDILYKHAFNNDYNEFLNLFNNLEVVQSEERPNWMLYRGIGLKYYETQDIMKKWLDEVYNLRGVSPVKVAVPKSLFIG